MREEKRIQLVLLTSDRGLCGGYNAKLIRAAEAFSRRQVPKRKFSSHWLAVKAPITFAGGARRSPIVI